MRAGKETCISLLNGNRRLGNDSPQMSLHRHQDGYLKRDEGDGDRR